MKNSFNRVLRNSVFVFGLASTLAFANYEEALPAIQKQDYAAALPLLTASAEKNDSRAMNALGVFYLQGLGVTRDEKTAIVWFEKAANAGNTKAMNGLAGIYGTGSKDAPKNVPIALAWAWKAALANDADAQFSYHQLVRSNELTTLDSSGRVNRDKYMTLAKRPLSERELDANSLTMLSRAAEQGHFASTVIAMGSLIDNVGPTNSQRALNLIEKLPLARMPPAVLQMIQNAKTSNTYLKSLGQTYVTATVFKDAMMTAILGASIKSKMQSANCDAKNMRVLKTSITRELADPVYLPVAATLLKDVVLIKGNWQETWLIDLCGTQVDVPLEFQADGGGGAYFQNQNKVN